MRKSLLWPAAGAVALALVAALAQQEPPTLRNFLVLNRAGNVEGLPAGLLDTAINGYAFDDSSPDFFVAFFDPARTLHAALLNGATGNWVTETVTVDDALGVGNSIVDVKRGRRYIYLNSHFNPSAGRLLVLSEDLKLRRALDGWLLAIFPDETIVYHRNQVHFAPTHSLEISAFNPGTGQDVLIYPRKPYPAVRRAFIERVSEVYKKRGEDWFREHNHHMNPEMFDSSLVGDVTPSGAGTITFQVRYGDPDNSLDPLPFTEQVLVTCGPMNQLQRIQCREEGR